MIASGIAQISFVAMVVVTLFAISTGERWIMLSVILHTANWLLVAAFQDHNHPPFQQTNFFIDAIGALLATLIAAKSGRYWAAAVAAFQCLGVVSRVAPLIDPSIYHRAAVTALYIWESGALIALAVGAGSAILSKPKRDSHFKSLQGGIP